MGPEDLIVAAAARPYPGESVSGDSWAVHWHGGTCRIVVADGLGHGPQAEAAASAAVSALAARPELGPLQALEVCHRALAGTRGAAISVACLDLVAARLTYAGVGNVEARLQQAGGQQRLIAYRGIVGSAMPTVREFELQLGGDWLLVLHTDGVSARFGQHDLDALVPTGPQALAEALLKSWGRTTDDATVVVARSRE